MLEPAFLGIHRHAAVVAHVLVGAGCDVEKRCFAAVGIAHQGHPDIATALLREFGNLAVEDGREGLAGMFGGDVRFCFFFADDFYLGCLLAAEGHFIAKYFIFDRVLERGVQDYAYRLAADETHFYQALAETSMARDLCYDGFLAGM